MKKIFYFDLEETIIESWHDPLLCNVGKVRDFIAKNNIEQIHIFSAAIWNDVDKHTFEKSLKIFLEGVFNIEILSWPSMEDVWKETQWKTVKFDNVMEMIAMIGKKRMFEDWCKWMHHKDSHCVLLDDSFEDEIIINRVHNTQIEVVNIINYKIT